MSVYRLRAGSIETNPDGEVVGASRAYIHLLGEDITDVIKRPEVRGITKSHEEARLPSVQAQQRNFRQYRSSLLRDKIKQPAGRRGDQKILR